MREIRHPSHSCSRTGAARTALITLLRIVFPLMIVCLLLPVPDGFAREVRVGVYENAPKLFTDEKGQAAGIFIDIIHYVGREEGWELVFVPGSWSEGLQRLEEGSIDLMPDVARSPERAEIFSFHNVPVISSWFQIYSQPGSGIQTITDLEGKRIAVLERSIQEDAFLQLTRSMGIEIDLVPTSGYEEMFQMTARGDVDAVITNRFFGLLNAPKYNLEDNSIIFHPTNLYYAASAGKNGDLLEALDRHLIQMKENPKSVYFQAMNRWTTDQVDFRLPDWVKLTGVIAGIAILMGLLGSLVLKRQVNLRNQELAQSHEQLQALYAELKLAMHSLNVSEKKYRTLYETANDAILLLRDGVIAECNTESIVLFGANRSQLIGGILTDYSDEEQPEGQKSVDKFAKLMRFALEEGALTFEWEFRRKDQSTFTAEISLNPVEVEGETLVQAIVRDITVRKQAEIALREMNVMLEQRVQERTKELEREKEKAESADRLKSVFLATMSHELRTPLNSIIGFTGILLQGLAGPLNEEQHKQMQMVRDSARHLLELINDVLDISKIEAGQLEVRKEPFLFEEAVRKVTDIVRPLAERKGVELEVAVEPEIGTLVSDQRRVEQILINLLNNAIKFTDDGKVQISVSMTGNGGQRLKIAVTDSGMGIKQEDMDKLFQPFRQIDSGLTRQHEGTGLGLTICKRLADLLGGTIQVESTWQVGSTFTLLLPRRGLEVE